MERSKPPDGDHALAWGQSAVRDPHWPAGLAVVVAMALHLTLPGRLTLGPNWLMPLLEGAVLVPLVWINPHRRADEPGWVRPVAVGLVAMVGLANAVALEQLVQLLLHGGGASRLLRGGGAGGQDLLTAAMAVWLTNLIVFALGYWELDRGGPGARCRTAHREPDFLFPQMATPGAGPEGWAPGFVDYLFVSATNAMAFSPTDTLPLTKLAKLLMMGQALASLATVALVAARAVNIIGG